jgi:hypothetical protein
MCILSRSSFLFSLSLLQYLSVCLLSNYIYADSMRLRGGWGGRVERVGRVGSMKERGVAWSVTEKEREGRIGREGRRAGEGDNCPLQSQHLR